MRPRVAMLWRRLLVLLIGGVIAVPYIAVIIWVITAWNQLTDRAAALGILAIGALIFVLLCVPAFLAVIRALERTLSEQLLELRIPTSPRRPSTADRLRGALFYFGHAFSGALLLLMVVVLLPAGVSLTLDPGQVTEFSGGRIESAVLPGTLIQILVPIFLVLLIAVVVAEGYFLPHYAQILLGPSAADRAVLAGADRVRRFRRTVLAREVHDSIGHALTVTTMQAAVAKRALRTDPARAEVAVDEIARTGREAVAELDRVLALLRTEAGEGEPSDADTVEPGREPGVQPRRTIRDLERLAEEARSVGHPTALSITGDFGALPAEVAEELHRIVREALTNALRHASEPGMSIDVTIGDDAVSVVARNATRSKAPVFGPFGEAAAGTEAGALSGAAAKSDRGQPDGAVRNSRGLLGIAERAAVFGGTVRRGVDDGDWVVDVVLPAPDQYTASADDTASAADAALAADTGGRKERS